MLALPIDGVVIVFLMLNDLSVVTFIAVDTYNCKSLEVAPRCVFGIARFPRVEN